MTLRVDVIETPTGGPVTLTKQSTAKASLNYRHDLNVVNYSFNISGVIDQAVGKFQASMINAFSLENTPTTAAGTRAPASESVVSVENIASSNIDIFTSAGSSSAADFINVSIVRMGDLA